MTAYQSSSKVLYEEGRHSVGFCLMKNHVFALLPIVLIVASGFWGCAHVKPAEDMGWGIAPKGVGSIPCRLFEDRSIKVSGRSLSLRNKENLFRISPEIMEALRNGRGSFYGVFDLDNDGDPEIFLDYYRVDDPSCQDPGGGISCIHLLVFKKVDGAYQLHLKLQAPSAGYSPGAWFLDETPIRKALFMTRYGGSSGMGLFWLNIEEKKLQLVSAGLFLLKDPVFEDLDRDGIKEIILGEGDPKGNCLYGMAIIRWDGRTYRRWWPNRTPPPYVVYATLSDLGGDGQKAIIAVSIPEDKPAQVKDEEERSESRELGAWKIVKGSIALIDKVKVPNADRTWFPGLGVFPTSDGAVIELDYDNDLVRCFYRNGKIICPGE